MSNDDVVIRVENLGKRYKLGLVHHDRLADAITAGIHWAGRGLRRLFPRNGRAAASSEPPLPAVTRHASRVTDSDELWALRNVSFEVQRGEVIGIIGRNGAGKSTLLKILTGITEPTEGRAWIKGRVASLLEVGTGFHPELTGRENIFLNGAILGMTKAEVKSKFDEIVAFAELERFLDTPVKRYSSGMYVRLAFAVAAHLEPEILLIDEVLAVGDAEFQKKCLGKMRDVGRQGRTVLFVSHNMAAVEGLCSSGIVLASGRAVWLGSARGAIDAYSNRLQSTPTALRDRVDREGNAKARAVGIRILNMAGQETDCVGMGEPFAIEIEVISVKGLRKAIIGLILGNEYRKQMIRGYTWEQVPRNIELGVTNTIRCHFSGLPMMHGLYDVHVWVGQQGEVADYVERATTLSVQPRDVFGTGRMPDPLGGVAYCVAKWQINGVWHA